MRNIVLPEKFIKEIAAKGGLYSRIWFFWLGNFVNEIDEEGFVEKQMRAYPQISEIKEIYDFGIQHLRQGIEIIDTDVENSVKYKTLVEVIEYLNKKAETTYKPVGKTKDAVYTRMKEGYTLSDFKIVIDKKTNEWIGTKDEKYLRPLTLFGTKFENYLNGKSAKSNGSECIDQFAQSIADAKVLVGIYGK